MACVEGRLCSLAWPMAAAAWCGSHVACQFLQRGLRCTSEMDDNCGECSLFMPRRHWCELQTQCVHVRQIQCIYLAPKGGYYPLNQGWVIRGFGRSCLRFNA
eukprot:704041-Pelagomonas_calceolata.AAC.1